jgi:hypothetical protein
VYNSPFTWDEPYSMWSPSHMRGLLYTCCKSDVFLSFFLVIYFYEVDSATNIFHIWLSLTITQLVILLLSFFTTISQLTFIKLRVGTFHTWVSIILSCRLPCILVVVILNVSTDSPTFLTI